MSVSKNGELWGCSGCGGREVTLARFNIWEWGYEKAEHRLNSVTSDEIGEVVVIIGVL